MWQLEVCVQNTTPEPTLVDLPDWIGVTVATALLSVTVVTALLLLTMADHRVPCPDSELRSCCDKEGDCVT